MPDDFEICEGDVREQIIEYMKRPDVLGIYFIGFTDAGNGTVNPGQIFMSANFNLEGLATVLDSLVKQYREQKAPKCHQR